MTTAQDGSGPLPPPPPKEAFSHFHQQRRAGELRRLSRHMHPELRGRLAEAVAQDLAAVLGPDEPGQGDVQCMRWIFENWRLDAIGERDAPAPREPVPGGHVQDTSRRFQEGSFTKDLPQEPAGPQPPCGIQGPAAGGLSETQPPCATTGQTSPMERLCATTGQTSPMEPPCAMTGQTSPMDTTTTTTKMAVAKGDVQGTRKLFETRPLDRLGSRPSLQDQSPLELRSELQELRGDVKKTIKLFQTQPLCAFQDAQGAMHEVRAACREEIQSHAVRTARWLFETRPLDAFQQDPSQVRVIRGISLEEVARPDVSAMQWIFETQPLDAIREMVVDEQHFQASPDLVLHGPGVQQQRQRFETRPLDTLKGEEEEEEVAAAVDAQAPPKEEIVPGNVRSTLWLFETQPLDDFTHPVQVGELQKVGHQEGEGPVVDPPTWPPSPGVPPRDASKGDVKAFQHLFETLPLDRIGQDELSSASGNISRAGTGDATSTGSPQNPTTPVYAMQDSKGRLYGLTAVSREQVLGGDVRGYRWMFETRPLDQLGGGPDMVDLVRGITRQEVRSGDVSTIRWLFETQPLATIHSQTPPGEGQEEEEEEGGPSTEVTPKGNVQTIRWLFETQPLSDLSAPRGSEATAPSCTWLFYPPTEDQGDGSPNRHLQANLVKAEDAQTDRHLFETEPLQPACRPGGGKGLVRCWSRVHIPSGHKETFQSLEPGQEEEESSRTPPDPGLSPPVCKFTWLFENGHLASLPPEKNVLEGPERDMGGAKEILELLQGSRLGLGHHGGIVIEARGPGRLYLAKFRFPGPAPGGLALQKEEVVSGELPGVVRQLLRRPDVEPQGLLVRGDELGRLQLSPLLLAGPMGDLHPDFQQLLACSLDPGMAKMGLVMQETPKGLVALTAYALQPRPAGGAPQRRGVQRLASCINHGDVDGLQQLRWEPPEDPTAQPAGQEVQKLPAKASIIHVSPLGGQVKMGCTESLPTTPCSPVAGEPREEHRAESDGGPGTPDFQGAMRNLRAAVAEARSLHRRVVDGHPQQHTPVVPALPAHDGLPGDPQGPPLRPGAGGDPKIPTEVSGEVDFPPRGLPGGRGGGTIPDSVYTAHPVKTWGSWGVGQASPEPQTAGAAHLQPHDPVPPLPAPPAVMTGPPSTLPGCQEEDVTWRNMASSPLQTLRDPAARQSRPEGVPMDTPKVDPARPRGKKPPVPPKPAQLAHLPPPPRLSRFSGLHPGHGPPDGAGREF